LQGILVRALAAVVVVSVGCGALTSASAKAVPSKFWGVVPQSLPTPEQFTRIKRGGVDSIRIPITWSAVQATATAPPDWSGVDEAITRAAQAGVDVLPYLYSAPGWVVPGAVVPGTHGLATAPRALPASGAALAAWTSFLKLAVARYGSNGAFWAANPSLLARPIHVWQIWNEENFKYFVVRPSPAEYGKLVKASSTAIKSVDPTAKILLGGLFARPKEAEYKVKPPQAYFATDFLEQMYRRTPGIKSKFDAIALHPYTRNYALLTPDIEEVRAVLKANGDAGKGLWITELGWSSEPPSQSDAFAKGPSGQVKQLKGALALLSGFQAKWRLRGVYWFSLEDGPKTACNFCGGAGLFRSGFIAKPSWKAFVKFTGGQPG
jgi:hypothetical protein